MTVTEQTVETEPVAMDTAPVVTEDELNDLGRLVLQSQREHVADYNQGVAKIEAATGDATKFLHELRNSSEDPKVLKFRKWLEDIDAKREAAVTEIDTHIKTNLMGDSLTMTPEEVTAEQTRLAELKKTIKEDTTYFGIATKNTGKDFSSLLASVSGARASVSAGTRTGPKPRITGLYVDGELQSHVVAAKGDKPERVVSTFTDGVKFLSDATKTKINTSTIHTAYLASAGVEIFDAAPAEVEFVLPIGDKNFTLLITRDVKPA